MIEFLDEVGTDRFYDIDDERTADFLHSFLTSNLYSIDDPRYKMLTVKAFVEKYNELTASMDYLSDLLREANVLVDDWFNWFESLELFGYIEFVMGPIRDRVENPNRKTLYFQRDNIDDESWTLYVWGKGEWRSVCDITEMLNELIKWTELDDYMERVKNGLLRYVDDEYIIQTMNEEYDLVVNGEQN